MVNVILVLCVTLENDNLWMATIWNDDWGGRISDDLLRTVPFIITFHAHFYHVLPLFLLRCTCGGSDGDGMNVGRRSIAGVDRIWFTRTRTRCGASRVSINIAHLALHSHCTPRALRLCARARHTASCAHRARVHRGGEDDGEHSTARHRGGSAAAGVSTMACINLFRSAQHSSGFPPSPALYNRNRRRSAASAENVGGGGAGRQISESDEGKTQLYRCDGEER